MFCCCYCCYCCCYNVLLLLLLLLFSRHERYLGMWVDNQRFGPGIVITSTGTYCEATFSDGMTGVLFVVVVVVVVVVVYY